MTEVSVTFGGVPVWLLFEYLIELGGSRRGDAAVGADGWAATLTPARERVGALTMTRVTVVIEGHRAEETLAALRRKALRSGG